MKNRKRFISITCGILAAIMLLSLVSGVLPLLVDAKSPSSSEIKDQIEQLEAEKDQIDAEIKALKESLDKNLTGMKLTIAMKQIVDQELQKLYEKSANINLQIMAYSQLIADKQEELDKAEAQLTDLTEKNKMRLRAMEENGDMSYWSVIFEAKSFSDLLDRIAMVQDLQAADQKRIKEMEKAADAVAVAKQSLVEEKTALEVMQQELDASQKELEAKSEEADVLLEELLQAGQAYEDEIHRAEDEFNKKQDEIAGKEDEYEDAKHQEYLDWLATSVPPTTAKPSYSGGKGGTPNVVGGITWLVPCDYVYMSSPFGWRIHPVYGDRRFHNGIDLAAYAGTPIIATRSGKITQAEYNWSAGNFVAVDHGDGFVTKYLHMTHYIVKVGDTVTAGQVIGYVGTTGTSTGNHLHFGVFYRGEAVNPALYINV